MATTTVRVDVETHAALQELGSESGRSLMETVRDAAEALQRERFAARAVQELATLRREPDAWAAYLAEENATSVADGLG